MYISEVTRYYVLSKKKKKDTMFEFLWCKGYCLHNFQQHSIRCVECSSSWELIHL